MSAYTGDKPQVDDLNAIDLATHLHNHLLKEYTGAKVLEQPDAEVEAAPNVVWLTVDGHRGWLKVTVEPMQKKRPTEAQRPTPKHDLCGACNRGEH